MQVAEGMSPIQSKAGMSKAPKSSKEFFSGTNASPALPPKPPRPSPARNASALTQFHDKSHGHDQGSNIKRKINWDTPTDNLQATAASETSSADTGVKVRTEYGGGDSQSSSGTILTSKTRVLCDCAYSKGTCWRLNAFGFVSR